VSRRWLLIDHDARRPAGISATETEHAAALQRMELVEASLVAAGWPAPVVADSGNGGHLLYRVDLPNDDASKVLLERCLKALDLKFSDEHIAIDTTTFNASRLTKLYGTVAGKGDSTLDRPHRLARLLSVPAAVVPVRRDLLEALAEELPPEPAPHGRNGHHRFDASAFDLDRWIAEHDLPVVATGTWQQGGRKWVLNPCPWDPAHQNRAAYIVQLANGAIGAGCLHTGCQGRKWHDLRRLYEPDFEPHHYGPAGGSSFSTDPPKRYPSPASPWPEPPGPAAYRGLAGRIVEAIDPHTEADRVAVLGSLLVAFGNAVGAGPHMLVGATAHTARLFAAFVGRTAKARKGDSWQPVRTLTSAADLDWSYRVMSGLASGEGVIWMVRDPITKTEPVKVKGRPTGETVTYEADPGVTDKRALIVETELARVLRVMSRQGNTLSPVLRDAWDTGTLRNLTKNSPATATGAHLSIISHITLDELRRELPDIEAANGFGNRLLWFLVRRSKELPEPEPFDGEAVDEITILLTRALSRARVIGQMERDPAARAMWRDIYGDLSAERDGLAGALTARAEAQTLRLSMLYALLDGSATVTAEHLLAALEVWAYCERSVEHIFGDRTGDPVADTILSGLRQNGELTRTSISDLFSRNVAADRIAIALTLLLTKGKARVEHRSSGGGRPIEVWIAV
jgi:hypothetical protein